MLICISLLFYLLKKMKFAIGSFWEMDTGFKIGSYTDVLN